MGSALRRTAACAAVLALVAMMPAPCPCPEESAAPPKGHECCAPPTGVSANDHGCCETHDSAEADGLTPAPPPVPSLTEVTVVRVEPVARLEGHRRSPVVVAPSPPPSILRL